jgi:hypothetical protein
MQDAHVELNTGLPWLKQHSTRLVTSTSDFKCKEETSSPTFLMMLELRHFGNQKYLEVFNMVLEIDGEDQLDR